ncbi:MAG: hypothetical protein GY810_19960 [Aureispira sp.]|nr:hypothetical protein [Aureispira sp.]
MLQVAIFLGGVFFWTFLEYTIHRFLGHKPKGRMEFTKEHLRHHREGHYFAPFYKKVIGAFIILGLTTLLFALPFGILNGFVFSFGVISMYLVYEVVHKRAHTHAPPHGYAAYLRKHHFYHHFRNPEMNHGVTSPVWDMVFRTYAKVDTVPVPKRMALKWLLDEEGALKNDFVGDYQLI